MMHPDSESKRTFMKSKRYSVGPDRICIVIPVFNDWQSIDQLLPSLDAVIGSRGWSGDIVLVDDGSTMPMEEAIRTRAYPHFHRLEVVRLLRNLGHQRAIAVGLTHLHQTRTDLRAIVVMDGDGEDKPEDVPRLVEELDRRDHRCVIFAARTKRRESWPFRSMYRLYRIVYRVLTGSSVRSGNFSALPPSVLPHLLVVSELWNHYAAAIFRSRVPFRTLPIERGRRYAGKSQMNFPNLILHGLSAISVFSDIVGVRFLVATVVLMSLAAFLAILVVAIRFTTDLAIPGWATNAVGLLVVVLIQSFLLTLVLAFITLNMRTHVNIIPLRDAPAFVGDVEALGAISGVEVLGAQH